MYLNIISIKPFDADLAGLKQCDACVRPNDQSPFIRNAKRMAIRRPVLPLKADIPPDTQAARSVKRHVFRHTGQSIKKFRYNERRQPLPFQGNPPRVEGCGLFRQLMRKALCACIDADADHRLRDRSARSRKAFSQNTANLHAALHQPGVMRVDLISPASSIAVANDQAARCTGIDVTISGVGL